MVRDAVLAGAGAAVLPRMLVVDELRTGRLSCHTCLPPPPEVPARP